MGGIVEDRVFKTREVDLQQSWNRDCHRFEIWVDYGKYSQVLII